MADAAESPAKILLPETGYDASLCPQCAERGEVTATDRKYADGWLLRRRLCHRCGINWASVELYASGKRCGVRRKGTAHRRMAALEVDAMDPGALGPDTETREANQPAK